MAIPAMRGLLWYNQASLQGANCDEEIPAWHPSLSDCSVCGGDYARFVECERQPVRFYRWADKIKQWRDQYAPGKPIWLGETGNAQFGGEPGLSDAYLGGLWWLDELGLLARKDHAVVVRQTLECFFYMATHHPLTPQTILSIFAPNS